MNVSFEKMLLVFIFFNILALRVLLAIEKNTDKRFILVNLVGVCI